MFDKEKTKKMIEIGEEQGKKMLLNSGAGQNWEEIIKTEYAIKKGK